MRRALRAFTVEGRIFLLASLLIGVSGVDVDRNHVYVFWCATFGALVASLIARPFARLDGARLEVELPRRVTLGEPLSFSLALDGVRDPTGLLIEGPRLPAGAQWTTPRPILELTQEGAARGRAEASFSRRGDHALGPFVARAKTPLGLALGAPIESAPQRVLVIPRVAPVARLSVREGHRYQPGGVALASKTGESMELLGVRPYRPGDPTRDLHARSWAKTGQPVVREYQQEYFARVGVILDTDRGAGGEATLEAKIELCAGVMANLSRGEALIDLLVLGDRLHPMTLGRSLGFLDQALDLLASVELGPSLSAPEIERRIAPFLPRLQSVVLVTHTWDDERRALVHAIRASGTTVRTLVVSDRDHTDLDLSVVSPAAVRGEDPLLL